MIAISIDLEMYPRLWIIFLVQLEIGPISSFLTEVDFANSEVIGDATLWNVHISINCKAHENVDVTTIAYVECMILLKIRIKAM